MDRNAFEYLKFIEEHDPFFYKNYSSFISYASGINKNLEDREYDVLKKSTKETYKVTLKDKKTSINIVKNFFYKISPSIIKQIDFDVINGRIKFVHYDNLKKPSRILVGSDGYTIEIANTSKIDEVYALVREYAHLFVGGLLDVDKADTGLKKVYIEMITSLTEFAFAKHLSFNKSLKDDSRNYINKKIYDSIYNMNDSYLTLMYLGFVLQGMKREDIIRRIGNETTIHYLDGIIKTQKPLDEYINTLGTFMALKEANATDNIYDLSNNFYIKATLKDLRFFLGNVPIKLNEKDVVKEICYYLNENK